VAQSAELSLEALRAVTAKPPRGAAACDKGGDNALHHLCRNARATAAMAAHLLAWDPRLPTLRNRGGVTPIFALLKAPPKPMRTSSPRRRALEAAAAAADEAEAAGVPVPEPEPDKPGLVRMTSEPAGPAPEAAGAAAASTVLEALIAACPTALHVSCRHQGQDRLPVQAAAANQSSALHLVAEASVAAGVVWCGRPVRWRRGDAADSAPSGFGMHVLLHALDKRERGNDLQEVVFDACVAGMAEQSTFREVTSLNGLPFGAADVATAVAGGAHIAFLLRDGRVFRVRARVEPKGAASAAPEIPEKTELKEVHQQLLRHQELVRRKKKALDDVKRADHGVDEAEIQMLVEITAKSNEECRQVARRIKQGNDRLELAMNILMGFAAMNSGGGDEYLLGDEVGKAQYEFDNELKRMAPYERRLRELTRVVKELERRQEAEARVYKPETLVVVSQLREWEGHPLGFAELACCASHLLALDKGGVLHAWAWAGDAKGPHARAAALCPAGDPIVQVASSALRTSVRLASGKVASWLDDVCQVSRLAAALEAEGADSEADEEEEGEEDEEEEEPEPASGPTWDAALSACHQGAGTWEFQGGVAEVVGGANYCIAVATVPFPSTGMHRCRLRATSAPENMAVGVVSSFADVVTHSHTSKGWLGNGPHGWCLFKDGDAAHGGSWKGGSYGEFAIGERAEIHVIVNADRRTVSFEVNGKLRRDVYKDLPDGVRLAVSLGLGRIVAL
jgi:hypothetical protein